MRLRVHVCAFVRVFVCVRVRTKRITEGREELYGLTLLRRSTRSRVERDARSLTSDRCIHSPALSRTLSRACTHSIGRMRAPAGCASAVHGQRRGAGWRQSGRATTRSPLPRSGTLLLLRGPLLPPGFDAQAAWRSGRVVACWYAVVACRYAVVACRY